MDFRLLGPVRVEISGETPRLPRRRERCLLAVLLLESNRVVPTTRLAQLLWDGEPTEQARPMIYSHVSRLRRVLATDGGAGILEKIGDGYRINIDPQTVDAHRFQTLLDQATAATDPTERIPHLRAALDLWRGPPLEDAASGWLRDRLCTVLEEQRLTATEDLYRTGLALRKEHEVLPQLAQLAAEHPGRETFTELHMRALYHAGRKAVAVAL